LQPPGRSGRFYFAALQAGTAKMTAQKHGPNHITVFKTPFFQGKFPSISLWIDLRNADTLRAGELATAMMFL
jgi:hypothetical protein